MKQSAFKFGGYAKKRRYEDTTAKAQWPAIIAADPVRYPGLMQEIALRALHRTGKPHREQNCPLCQEERLELAS